MGHGYLSWKFLNCKVEVPCVDLIQSTLLEEEKKQLRKHRGHGKPGEYIKYIGLTVSYKGWYFSFYRLWNGGAEGPTVDWRWVRKPGSEASLLISSPVPRQPEWTSLNIDIVNAAEGWDDTIWKGFSLICIIINTCISGIN